MCRRGYMYALFVLELTPTPIEEYIYMYIHVLACICTIGSHSCKVTEDPESDLNRFCKEEEAR